MDTKRQGTKPGSQIGVKLMNKEKFKTRIVNYQTWKDVK
jgi:hypothetical protein